MKNEQSCLCSEEVGQADGLNLGCRRAVQGVSRVTNKRSMRNSSTTNVYKNYATPESTLLPSECIEREKGDVALFGELNEE